LPPADNWASKIPEARRKDEKSASHELLSSVDLLSKLTGLANFNCDVQKPPSVPERSQTGAGEKSRKGSIENERRPTGMFAPTNTRQAAHPERRRAEGLSPRPANAWLLATGTKSRVGTLSDSSK